MKPPLNWTTRTLPAHQKSQSAFEGLDPLTRGLLTDYFVHGKSAEVVCERWQITMPRFRALAEEGLRLLAQVKQ